MQTTKTDKTIAIEILKQLGGNKFIAMTGAKNFTCDDRSMGFMIPRAKDGIRYVKITLNSMDTYDLEFKSLWRDQIKTVCTFEGAYNDMLQNVFTSKTGLYTRL